METLSRRKLKKSSDSEEADDRISYFSDDVLIHILSFIPTLDSVATCMLSKRWKNLWKHVPILTFDDTLPPSEHNVRYANIVNTFLDLHVVEKLSLRCNNDKIYDVGDWITRSIMRNIKSLDLTICNSNVPDRLPVRLPSCLFTCATLEALVLEGTNHNIIVNLPTTVCLPKLKTMKLAGLKYQDDQRDCLGKLISSCSSLESLVVEDRTFWNHYVGFLSISSSTLRDMEFRLHASPCLIGFNPEIFCSALRRLNLKISSAPSTIFRVPSNVYTWNTLEHLVLEGLIVSCVVGTICLPNLRFLALHFVEFQDDEMFSTLISSCTSLESLAVSKTIEAELNISSCTLKVIEVKLRCTSKPGQKLVINAPALRRLKLRSSGYVDYHIQELASLEHADVHISFDWFLRSEYCSSVLTNAYQALRHVKSLKICQGYSHVGIFEHVLPMFNRLIDLDITLSSSVGYLLFREIIKNSTKLENLVCVLNFETLCNLYWRNLSSVPACLLSSLRSVSIRRFKGQKDDLTMTTYILGNARIMEKMEVSFCRYYHHSEAMKRELCTKILNVPRGSEKCVVVFN